MDGRTEEYIMQNLEFRLHEGSAFRNETSTYKKSPHLLHMWSSLAFNQERFKPNFPGVWFRRRRWQSGCVRVLIREPIYFRAGISLHLSYREKHRQREDVLFCKQHMKAIWWSEIAVFSIPLLVWSRWSHLLQKLKGVQTRPVVKQPRELEEAAIDVS